MPLRLVNKQRTHKIEVCGTTFHIISMSIGDKEQLINRIQTVGPEDGAFDRLLDVIAPAIESIDGYDSAPREVLSQLEELEDLKQIIQAIIKHCALTPSESKNSLSSSAQRTPGSAGSAEKPVGPDDEPASTTPKQTD